MVVDLLVHEVPAEEEALDRRQPLAALDGQHPGAPAGGLGVGDLAEAERPEQPVEVVEAVASARHVAVAQQVVRAVHVQGAAHRAGQVRQPMGAREQIGDPLGGPGAQGLERAVDLRRRVAEDVAGPGLVVPRVGHHVLEEVAERAVAEVVQERGGDGLAAGLAVEPELGGELPLDAHDAPQEPGHHVGCADGVSEAGMLGTGEDEGGQPELTHAAKALHLTGREERLDDRLVIALELDEAVDGVPKDHARNLP